MGPQTITVDFDGQLSIDPSPCDVRDGDWVVWQFKNVPVGGLPYIKFASGFGPFRSLRAYQGTQIVSKGHFSCSGNPEGDSHEYTAMILQPAMHEPVALKQGKIVNHVTSDDPLPEVLVTYDGGSNVEVSPDHVRINEGDVVSWRVTGLKNGEFVTFQFLDGQGDAAYLFTSFSLQPEGSDVRASAFGFLAGKNAPGSFTYQVRVRDKDGKLLGWQDPAIDNIGPPIPPGDDGGS